jgi:hypothetical protein
MNQEIKFFCVSPRPIKTFCVNNKFCNVPLSSILCCFYCPGTQGPSHTRGRCLVHITGSPSYPAFRLKDVIFKENKENQRLLTNNATHVKLAH